MPLPMLLRWEEAGVYLDDIHTFVAYAAPRPPPEGNSRNSLSNAPLGISRVHIAVCCRPCAAKRVFFWYSLVFLLPTFAGPFNLPAPPSYLYRPTGSASEQHSRHIHAVSSS
eukprot:1076144-Prorocentrum_minimum.AAC.1